MNLRFRRRPLVIGTLVVFIMLVLYSSNNRHSFRGLGEEVSLLELEGESPYYYYYERGLITDPTPLLRGGEGHAPLLRGGEGQYCVPVTNISHNNADIQVSELVETLDFRAEKGESIFLNTPVTALAFTEHVHVILLPHSHCDPGWLETYEHYYTHRVKLLLTNLYKFAMAHSDFTYIYAEVSFFKLWWEEQGEEVREGMRRLAREDRFEFVQGGWVQNDEANTHYFAILNQMLDGHDWLKANFPEARPRVGWAIDPFGLSPMMGYVNKLFGFKGMHIQRVHYAVKKHLAFSRQVEFKWRQSWDKSGNTDMLTHLGPFDSYNVQNSCGPDTDICKEFNFAAFKNHKFERHRHLVETSDSNLKDRSLRILDQWRKKAALHSQNVVFVELGTDFSYMTSGEVEDVYHNYKPMIDYINSDEALNTTVRWGTVSDYFEKLLDKGASFPTLSGDFFTYADRNHDYWSGYYTTRPFYKNLDRVLEGALRRCEILYSFSRPAQTKGAVLAARNTLSLFQHHDAITGTAKPHVVVDYGMRLFRAYQDTTMVSIAALKKLLRKGSTATLTPTKYRKSFDSYEKARVLEEEGEVVVSSVITRSLAAVEHVAVTLHGNYKITRTNKDLAKVSQSLEPAITYGEIDRKSKFIVFGVTVPSVSINSYLLTRAPDSNHGDRAPEEEGVELSVVTLYNTDTLQHIPEVFLPSLEKEGCNDIVLGGGGDQGVSVTVNCKTGEVTSLSRDGKTVTMETELVLYAQAGGGAYLFKPGPQSHLLTSTTRPHITLIQNKLRHRAVVEYQYGRYGSRLVLTYTVNLIGGEASDYLDIELLSDMRDYGDLSLRFKTDIHNGDSLFTDLNGHTLQQHRYKAKLTTQGNFFPVPTTAFIQDSTRRLTVVAAQPHGGASLKEGWLELILDRRLRADDYRGLGEGVKDNVPTPAHLRLLIEEHHPDHHSDNGLGYVVDYPSLSAHWSLQTLLNPLFVVFQRYGSSPSRPIQLMKGLGCTEELVNFRHVQDATSLLILRKLGISCNVPNKYSCPDQTPDMEDLEDAFVAAVKIRNHPLSPFEGSTDGIRKGSAMEFSSFYLNFLNPEFV